MSVSSVTGGGVPVPPNGQQQDFRAAFQQLTSAINSGDLDGAKGAYATLASRQPGPGASDGQNPMAKLLSSIGSDLNSGDLSGAQSVLQQFQQARSGHHHHHRTSGAEGATPDASSPSATTAAPPTSSSQLDILA